MKELFRQLNLAIFDTDPGAGTDPAPSGGTQPAAGQQQQPAGSYSYQQAEEIATARAQKAERAALASYFKQQGLDESQVTEAIRAYKAAQEAKKPDVQSIQKERDDALEKLAAYERQETLTAKGVKPRYAKFVAYEVAELMKADSKLDSFDKAAEKYLKDNPQYADKPYKVKGAEQPKSGGSGNPNDKESARAAANEALKLLARRGK